MFCPPIGQQLAKRCSDRRQGDTKPNISRATRTVLASCSCHSIEFRKNARDVKHHCPASGRQTDTRMAALKERRSEFVLESADSAADSRCTEPE
jgi:predicted RNA-binding Zn-ribbon protein involved in translation (DUF1610 family)